ncbi:MAG: winged helix-turn-helix transcriptional regulator [Deltaproteobacteria bacterium]|nr:winged helix-turn-helix transcriptional regulator [Deltaproteobacteria bacterium]MBW2072195.1 winged helix-turn-helix transcriptional regulator [Deltaproteobacteria bacterium]
MLELLVKPVAAICKSLADENRLRILLAIGRDRKSVTQIVEAVGLSQPLVSHHLKELRRSHLLKVERQGPFIYYQISNGSVLSLLSQVSEMAKELIDSHEPF